MTTHASSPAATTARQRYRRVNNAASPSVWRRASNTSTQNHLNATWTPLKWEHSQHHGAVLKQTPDLALMWNVQAEWTAHRLLWSVSTVSCCAEQHTVLCLQVQPLLIYPQLPKTKIKFAWPWQKPEVDANTSRYSSRLERKPQL